MAVGRNYLAIASHRAYHTALDALLDSMHLSADSSWPSPDDVVVLLSGEQQLGTPPADPPLPHLVPDLTNVAARGVTRVFGTYTSIYEYGAFFLPLAMDANDDDAFILLHDTCHALPGFASRAADALRDFRSAGVDILWCTPTGQCNICVFNRRASQAAWQSWGSWNSLDKMHAIHMEHQHNHPHSLKANKTIAQAYAPVPQRVLGIQPVYSRNVQRTNLFIPYLDISKFYCHITQSCHHPNTP